VTLTINGDLRGCSRAGAIQAVDRDVRDHAAAAALDDPRFMPVKPDELERIDIEVSRLTVQAYWTMSIRRTSWPGCALASTA